MARSSKKEEILLAAATIVNEQGADYLTLDAVAEKAGVSKGGLLYHVKSKAGLIEDLVRYANDLYQDNVNQNLEETETESQTQWLNAFIEATREHRTGNAPITSAMLAAQGMNKQLLSPLIETYQDWQSKIETGELDKVDATIIRLAIDGLWLSEIFGMSAIDESMREDVLNRLKTYTERR
ncbi:TetR/AcrR family transcriptional regulator [Staphylococcus canis]|uniref:TetR/AcrR family transcriptional regulator n=1 Tax=Staphylococcus canis TaxID=2724942 RepID=A0ABS0TAS2_9STAP|nr:TetR/AcrR family transcriptional regulator [Staphylococcus canis]MBI5974869.1 TetR/AcrR family transcriptional regulator [Staphylococcus canis]